jgi:hypothetical protein
MKSIDRSRLQSLMQREQQRYIHDRPKSKAMFERAGKSSAWRRAHELDDEVGWGFSSICA